MITELKHMRGLAARLFYDLDESPLISEDGPGLTWTLTSEAEHVEMQVHEEEGTVTIYVLLIDKSQLEPLSTCGPEKARDMGDILAMALRARADALRSHGRRSGPMK